MEEFIKAQYQLAMKETKGWERELHKAVKNGNWRRFETLCEFYYCLRLGETEKIVNVGYGLYLKFKQVSKVRIECYACYAESEEDANEKLNEFAEKVANAEGRVPVAYFAGDDESYHIMVRGWFKSWLPMNNC